MFLKELFMNHYLPLAGDPCSIGELTHIYFRIESNMMAISQNAQLSILMLQNRLSFMCGN
jgi:hypothetical protein